VTNLLVMDVSFMIRLNEYARFYTAFRMTYPGFFCHSERAFGRGRIPTVSAGSA